MVIVGIVRVMVRMVTMPIWPMVPVAEKATKHWGPADLWYQAWFPRYRHVAVFVMSSSSSSPIIRINVFFTPRPQLFSCGSAFACVYADYLGALGSNNNPLHQHTNYIHIWKLCTRQRGEETVHHTCSTLHTIICTTVPFLVTNYIEQLAQIICNKVHFRYCSVYTLLWYALVKHFVYCNLMYYCACTLRRLYLRRNRDTIKHWDSRTNSQKLLLNLAD